MSQIKTIWLIEDDEIFVFGIKRLIKKLETKIEIFSYPNGAYAIDALKNCINDTNKLPDIILLDLYMPVMDGWEFLDEYRLLPIEKSMTTIYMLTSSDNDKDLVESKNYPEVTDFFIKPLEEIVLEKIIK